MRGNIRVRLKGLTVEIKAASTGSDINASLSIYDLGDCIFNAAYGELQSKINHQHIHFEPKVSEVLQCLAQAQGDVVTREFIFDHVWPNQIVSDDSLNRCISVLRKSLRSFDHQVKIKTHPKIGFHLEYAIDETAFYEKNSSSLSTLNRRETDPLQTNYALNASVSRIQNISKGFFIAALILVIITIGISIYLNKLAHKTPQAETQTIVELSPYRLIIFPFGMNEELSLKYKGFETTFRQLFTNHPLFSTIAQTELLNAPNLPINTIAQQFNARFIVKAKAIEINNRDILKWQLIDGQTSEVIIDRQLNIAINTQALNVRLIATDLVEHIALFNHSDDKRAKIEEIVVSANYLFLSQSNRAFQRPAINLLAQNITETDPDSVLALKTLAKLLTQEVWAMKEISHPYMNLALNSLNKAILLSPLDPELYQLLARIQMSKYQWQEAHKTLSTVEQRFKQQGLTTSVNLHELQHQTGQLSGKLLKYYQDQHRAAPLDIEHGLSLACVYMQMEEPIKAISITNSLMINDDEWGETGALIGPAYIRAGDQNKGRHLFFTGYASLGVPQSYIDVLYQGILHPNYQQQASDFLTQAANDGIFDQPILLYMYAELSDIDAYFDLAFELTNSYQYRLVSAMRSNAEKIRQHPKFIPLMEKLGLTDYWMTYGLPDFCKLTDKISCV